MHHHSILSAMVFTGANVTVFQASRATPGVPVGSTGVHWSPFLYSSRHEAGTRTLPRPVSSNHRPGSRIPCRLGEGRLDRLALAAVHRPPVEVRRRIRRSSPARRRQSCCAGSCRGRSGAATRRSCSSSRSWGYGVGRAAASVRASQTAIGPRPRLAHVAYGIAMNGCSARWTPALSSNASPTARPRITGTPFSRSLLNSTTTCCCRATRCS